MKRNGFDKLFSLFPVVLLGVAIFSLTANAARHTITSLPYTASTDYDTLTLSGTKVSGSGNGISVQAHDVYIDLGTDTLEFGRSGGGNCGINLSGAPYNIVISGGTILHGGNGDYNLCVRLSRTHDVLIENTNMIVNGTNGHCIISTSVGAPGNYNIEISGGEYWNNCHGYTNRCQYDGAAIRLWSATYGGYGDYHYKIHDITLHTSPGQGIMFQGRDQTTNAALVYVYNNTITCDARNTVYSSYSGTCKSSANPYSIALLKCAPGSEIYSNTIVSGTTYGGSRGILIENCLGTSSEWIKIHDNYVDVHEGPNVEYGEGGTPVYALRIRAIDGSNKINYIHVYDNTFIGTGDGNASTKDYNSRVAAFVYSDRSGTDHIIVENNTFRAKSNTVGVLSMAVVFDFANTGGLVFRNNRIEGDGTLVKFGYVNYGAKNITLRGNTLAFLNPAYNSQTFHVGHLSNNWNCSDNYAEDMTYENGASDKDIVMANRGTLELGLRKTLLIYVKGNNALPVPGASVRATNNYGRRVLSGTTDGDGAISGMVTYWWEQRTGSDSTDFNSFTIKVQKGNDSTVITHIVSSASSPPVITLENTPGEGEEDTTSPGRIIDLGVKDPTPSSVRLTWTAPGDDGDVGVASEYDIRYSTANISESNWGLAIHTDGEPIPRPAGNAESFTISNLIPNTTYFFAIKTRDEVHNWSELSNVVSHGAEDQMPPAPIDDLAGSPGTNMGEILLTWTATGDDGDVGTADSYEIGYSTGKITELNWSSVTLYDEAPVPLASGSDMSFVMSGLSSGERYYIAIKAYDDAGNSSKLSNVASAIAQIDLNFETDDSVRLLYPDENAVVASSRPSLVVENIDSSAQNVYYFELAADSTFDDILAADTVEQEPGNTTSWKIPIRLTANQKYYWRVKANSSDFSGFSWFMVRLSAHVYPNPLDLSVDPVATFAELPENSSLILVTVSGLTVRRWTNITGGEVTWGGDNEAGNAVTSGTYLWFIEGTELNGKLVVQR